MRILVASKFYYDRGGAEIVARRCVEAYKSAGYEVAVLAMDHPRNCNLPATAFLAPEVSFSSPARMALRTLGLGSVRRAVRQALDEFRPDVVHLHNVHSYLSPLVGEMAHERGIRVVWTLHDYKLLCGAYSFPMGEGCRECSRNPLGLVRHRCLHGSLSKSAMGVLEAMRWNRSRLIDFTDLFVAPSSYMADVMVRGGFPEDRVRVVGNCVGPEFLDADPSTDAEDYFLYAGRISPEKGVDTLLKAVREAGVTLKIVGDGALLQGMKRANAGFPDIEFTGSLSQQQVAAQMRRAKAVVVPSEWPENNPLVVMEALCSGTPVIGSKAGGIPELLDEGSGIMFEPGNTARLAEILRTVDSGSFDRLKISEMARRRHSPDSFSRSMVAIIEEVRR